MGLNIRLTIGEDGGYIIETNTAVQRPGKGSGLLLALDDFTAIDLETTGLSSIFDNIIELSAVRFRAGKEVASFSQLVNPGYMLDPFITELTGITDEMLAYAPRIERALPDYLAFLADDVLIGHNIHFDINFLYDAAADCGLPPVRNDFIDTMRISRRMFKAWPNHRLDTLIEELNLGSRELHRAENDARLTAHAYLKMKDDPSFSDAMKPAKRSYNTMANRIVAREGYTNEDSPLYGKVCVFTGALESLTRQQAMQLVVDIGGICGNGVTKQTNYLILGNNDYCKSIKDGKSAKQKKAEKLILEGADLQIIPESVFLEMLSEEMPK